MSSSFAALSAVTSVGPGPTAFQWLTLGVAIAGVLLGLGGLLVQGFTLRSDRPKLRVRDFVGPTFTGGLGAEQLFIEVHNAGKRPVSLADAGLFLRGDATVSFGASGAGLQSTRLDVGETTQAWAPMRDVAAIHAGEHGPVTRAWVRDAGGRIHKSPTKNWSFLNQYLIENTDSPI